MQSRGSIPHTTTPVRANLRKLLCALVLPLLAACIPKPLLAQDAPPSPPQPLYTLHLDTRLAQVPTLILNYGSKPIPLFPTQRVDITIDNGHKFHPARVRFEGDDPITLSILLDLSTKDPYFLRPFQKDFSRWIATSFQPQDRISIYALDCSLLRTADNQPPTPSLLQAALETAINSPLSHGKKARPSCGHSVHLRGAMDYLMQQLAPLPGRHVLFVLSTGYDGGSIPSWNDLPDVATGTATTVFGIIAPTIGPYGTAVPLDNFAMQSGGLLFQTNTSQLPSTLAGFIAILRRRQILEFPIPLDFPGDHIISVSIEHANVEARPSGIPILAIPEAPLTIPAPPQSTPPEPQP